MIYKFSVVGASVWVTGRLFKSRCDLLLIISICSHGTAINIVVRRLFKGVCRWISCYEAKPSGSEGEASKPARDATKQEHGDRNSVI